MSHSVTIRTQTVTTNSTAIIINTGYLKTWSGILKFLQLALGIVCVAISASQLGETYYYQRNASLFFLLMTTTFMIGTFVLLLSCLVSLSTSSLMSKTIYELLYHAIAFGLTLAASLTLLSHVSNNKGSNGYQLMLIAGICCLINSAFYLCSTIIALRTYRGI